MKKKSYKDTPAVYAFVMAASKEGAGSVTLGSVVGFEKEAAAAGAQLAAANKCSITVYRNGMFQKVIASSKTKVAKPASFILL